MSMSHPGVDFLVEDLRPLVEMPITSRSFHELGGADCIDVPGDVFHPPTGRPPDWALALCRSCPARLPCLALAVRSEATEQRHGWYGGLGPAERARIAGHIDGADVPPSNRIGRPNRPARGRLAGPWTRLPAICAVRAEQRSGTFTRPRAIPSALPGSPYDHFCPRRGVNTVDYLVVAVESADLAILRHHIGP